MTEPQGRGPDSRRLLWQGLPALLDRLSPMLGRIAQDGRYLHAIPYLAPSLILFGALIGIMAGLAKGDRFPYTANFALLAALMTLGILSGRTGLLAFLGFVAADAAGLFRSPASNLALPYVCAVLVSWFFLFQLLAAVPLAARLLGGLRGRWTPLGGLIVAILGAGLAELWTRLSMVALRPLYTWRGKEAALDLVSFVDPAHDWSFGPLTLHKLAWIALAAGLARWAVESIVTARAGPLPDDPRHAVRSRSFRGPWWLGAAGKAAAITAIIAGMFATIAGALAFWLAIVTAIAVRILASTNPWVARWDGWMSRTPAALRLIVSYALCFFLAEALVELLRGILDWRTMTSAAAAMATAFAVSLLFWPQVTPDQVAPTPPRRLQKLFEGANRGMPGAALILLMFVASTAYAHHCSFRPGCECLTDDSALAGLVAAGAVLGLVLSWIAGGIPINPVLDTPLRTTPGGGFAPVATSTSTEIPGLQMAADETDLAIAQRLTSLRESPTPLTNVAYGEKKGDVEFLIDGERRVLESRSNASSDSLSGEYQCVELIERYAGFFAGSERVTGLGNGKSVAENLPSATGGAFEFMPDGSPIEPVLGSVVSINLTGTLSEYGHVGIVQGIERSGDTMTVTLFDQNWPTDISGAWKTVTFNKRDDGGWTGSMLTSGRTETIVGWANPL